MNVLAFLKDQPYIFAGVIIVGAVIAAVFVNLITTRVILRLTRRTETVLDDQIITAIRLPLFFSVVMIGVTIAQDRVATSDENARQWVNPLLITAAILIWTAAGMKIGKAVLASVSRRADESQVIQPRTLPLFDIALKTFILGGAAYGILVAWHVDVTAWLASAGILGIAIGFAAKDTLSNLFSGIFILADAPYKVGDFIVLDSGERGQVTDIGVRSTRILTRDDIQIIIPNATIANAKIVNETGGPSKKERIRVRVGVAYGSDIDKVHEVLIAAARASSFLAADPEPRVRFREFGDSSLNFELLGWIDEPLFRGQALDELNTIIYKQFAAENITIPFPQRDVHVISD
ncbi:MAG: mechanosensitive ion channel [Myxococcota bacterium]|nr:mechanosensitive ion channel [Myxococcota bacterium]